MNHSRKTHEHDAMTTLATLTPGAVVRLHNRTVELADVDQLGRCQVRGSAAYGLDLTEVAYLRRGRLRRRIYPSITPVERVAA